MDSNGGERMEETDIKFKLFSITIQTQVLLLFHNLSFYFHFSLKSGYHSYFQSILETFAKMNLNKSHFSHLNYIIGLLKYLLWLTVLSLQNSLQPALTILRVCSNHSVQLVRTSCLYHFCYLDHFSV